MKTVAPLNSARLTHLEFGQHVKSVSSGINFLGIVTDAVFVNYLTALNAQATEYDRAMLQIFKSDETAKIAAADAVRDTAITAITRSLYVYEVSDDANEKLAFDSLQTLFNTYSGIQYWNLEAETNGIVNLVVDLQSPKYSVHVTLLNLANFVDRLEVANNAFVTLFEGRTQETASKEVFDVKKMRSDMKEVYTDMIGYVLAMAKAANTDEFNKSLDVINTVRKYYDTLLAKRAPAKKDEIPTPIPPME